jgi:hypothetical protein
MLCVAGLRDFLLAAAPAATRPERWAPNDWQARRQSADRAGHIRLAGAVRAAQILAAAAGRPCRSSPLGRGRARVVREKSTSGLPPPPWLPRPSQQPRHAHTPSPIKAVVVDLQPSCLALICRPSHPFGLGWRPVYEIPITVQRCIDLLCLSLRPSHAVFPLRSIAKAIGVSAPELMATKRQKKARSATARAGASKPPPHTSEWLSGRFQAN